mmetsp:Transcript_9642/g.16950  ORF Transcript_9642/g.16950 Transcript_9642/m.16950 type:complete len:597 (+) Transcript_9642:149-1939(+)|eukprot:CAMPEP_0184541270 /NCGR_PEP_ID=MMETSP0199_2-20130426/1281_1 /TAXON_ID=1112570 /ORGANISM="Thraustochytrium sp., Strain LLF1b" /LENGTH=596 /DNA_ID=CAMNT_0026934983 /DNA_START=54 /DNA_END=1844 /DNA_ORIENTATION=-
MNSGAKEWKPNATAKDWTPSWAQPAAAAAPAAGGNAAAPAAEQAPAAPAAPSAEVAAPTEAVEAPASTPAPEASVDEAAASLEATSISAEAEAKAEVKAEPKATEAAPKEEPAAPVEKAAAPAQQDKPAAPAKEAAPANEPTVDSVGLQKEVEKQLEMIKDADKRDHLNVVFIGHVDAGKSTLSGAILYALGTVDKRTIERYEQEAKERNRESWFLAYIMDTNEEERAKGKTVEVGRAFIETENKRITILDAPGHKNYVPAMISGASQADVGILVISARKGEFEAGFDGLGQTREHAMLAKTLGIQKLVVVINKMDEQTVKWSEERYESCVKKLRPFLKGCGYRVKRDVTFLPISALSGHGVQKRTTADVCPWAPAINGGKSLLEILDETVIAGRDESKALRMTIVERYNDRGVVLMGKIESGVIYVGQTVCVCPNQTLVKVDSITINEEEVQGAKPGENVLVRCGQLNDNEVSKGHVVCSKFYPVIGRSEILAQVHLIGLLEHRPLLSAGYNAVFHAHTAEEECTVTGIKAILDHNGKITKKNPPFARTGSSVIVSIELSRSIVLEEYEKTPTLGRFTLRDEGTTIAIGIIKRLK